MNTLIPHLWRFLSLPKNLQLFIMRLFQDQFLIGVTGIIFNEKQQILLCKHTYRQTMWALPGGYMKAKEHPEEGIEREIEEETGFTVSIDSQLKVRTDRGSARLDICLIGKFIAGEFKPSAEVSEAGFFSFDSLPQISKTQLLLIRDALKQQDL